MKLIMAKIKLETVEIERFDSAKIIKTAFHEHDTRRLKCALCGEVIEDESFILGWKEEISFAIHVNCADEKTLYLCNLDEIKQEAIDYRLIRLEKEKEKQKERAKELKGESDEK